MRKAHYIILLLLTHHIVSSGQSMNNKILESLFYYDHPIATISWDGFNYVSFKDEKDLQFEKFAQCLIRNNNGLFVFINGSGRLYKASLNDGKISFHRIDSTVYFGSNFKSFAFSYKDIIYNLGGYGFWKTNGLLRYYVERRREWEIIKLNKEIPLQTENSYDLIWYDQPQGKIYFGFIREENNVTMEEQPATTFHYESYMLDLEKKEWIKLGNPSDFLKKDLVDLTNITSSPWGQMVNFKGKYFFLNYKENKIYQLKLSQQKQRIMELFATNTGDAHVYYFKDSTFFSGIGSKNLLDSITFRSSELELLDEKIYIPETEKLILSEKDMKKENTYLYLLGVAAFIILILFVSQKKIFRPAVRSQIQSGSIVNHNIFTDIEKQVLKSIAANSQKGKMTSIDELNRVLGVNKKSVEIQKKQRSDVISSINKKYSYINKSNKDLIERKQAEFDKRSFEYYIDYNNLDHLFPFLE